ncbi:MAG: chemotaxis protein CheA [Treponemataceae bacterium]|nr:chemotaxis protein CheA [Treponemataceae bacterium]
MSDYLDPNNEELLKDFFSEAQMQVETLEQNILVLEQEGANRDAVDEIFRAAHTLKGGAATVEMQELAHFTHLVEDVLDAIRSGNIGIDESVIDILLQAIDIIKAMLHARMHGEVYHEDITGIESRLTALLPAEGTKRRSSDVPKKTAASPSSQVEAKTTGVAGSVSEYEILEMKQQAAEGQGIYKVTVTFNEDNVMNTVGGIQVFAALKNKGTILKTNPDFEQLYEDNFFPVVEYYIATHQSVEEIKRTVQIPDVTLAATVEELTKEGLGGEKAPAPSVPSVSGKDTEKPRRTDTTEQTLSPVSKRERAFSASLEPVKSEPKEGQNGEQTEEGEKKNLKDMGSILRVDSRRIDNLLNLVSETVITKATFNQISNQFGELMTQLQGIETIYREKIKDLFDSLPEYLDAIQKGQAVKEIRKEILEKYGDLFTLFDPIEVNLKAHINKFRSTAQNLGRISGELQEGVMRIRMVPISQIFNRFPRLVRDLSKSLNKKVNLVIEGEETELDKSVIEDLLDPIMHSVRNSIDHGIEHPEDRRAAGKNETGTVLLKASNEGNMIIIEIADDGKGIDVEAVRAKAVERGLIHPNKILTDVEAFNLIFEPGFSTAKQITNISGRGVGLDVVRRQIEKLNGTVTVHSERGRGTRFIIKLPLTLAIIQGLLVRVGKEIYSIPITSVIESHRIKPSDIRMIDNYEVFNVRNDVISLLRLNRLFGIKTDEQRDYYFVVIVGTAEKKMGLMVDSLIGEEDVVIKPLRDQFTASPGIAGASILGDGSVSLIIDVSQLLELGLRKEREERQRREAILR